MEKTDIKTILMPVIQECVREIIQNELKSLIMEEKGVLSHIVTEIAQGLNIPGRGSVEKSGDPTIPFLQAQHRARIQREKIKGDKGGTINEARNKLATAVGGGVFTEIFQDIQPLKAQEDPNSPDFNPLNAGGALENEGVDLSKFAELGLRVPGSKS